MVKGRQLERILMKANLNQGLPDGSGTYKWSNGNTYNGSFDRGFKEWSWK